MKWMKYKSFNMVLLGFSAYGLCTFHMFFQHGSGTIHQLSYIGAKHQKGFNLQPECLSGTMTRFGQGEKGTCLSPECEVSAFD